LDGLRIWRGQYIEALKLFVLVGANFFEGLGVGDSRKKFPKCEGIRANTDDVEVGEGGGSLASLKKIGVLVGDLMREVGKELELLFFH
jgi:hypothetical protein